MSLTSRNQRLISYKKLVGKAHTSAEKEAPGEFFGSSLQMASSTIFGEALSNNNVQEVIFILEPAEGSQYQGTPSSDTGENLPSGQTQTNSNHGFVLKLSQPVLVNGVTYGVDSYLHQHPKLQIIPESFGSQYRPKVYSSENMDAASQMAQDGSQDWVLDCFAGTLFMQDIYISTYPVRLTAYVYTGKYLDEMVEEAASSGGGATPAGASGQIQFHDGDTPAGLGASSNLIWDNTNNKLDVKGQIISQVSNIGNNSNITIKKLGDVADNNVSFTFSHRSEGNRLWLYSTSGNGFTNFVSFRHDLNKIYFPVENAVAPPPGIVIDIFNKRLGVGTDEPSQRLHVVKVSSGQNAATSNSIAVFENNTNGFISILTPSANQGGVIFGSPSSNVNGGVIYDHSQNSLQLRTNNNITRLTIDNIGNVISKYSFYALAQGTNDTSNIHIRKDANISSTNIDFIFSHRQGGKELLLYGNNGTDDLGFVTFKADGTSIRTVSFPTVDAELLKIDLINEQTVTNGSSYIYPKGTNSSLYLERNSGSPTIKSLDNYLIMDSYGDAVALNYYINDDVLLAKGGGNVGIGNIPSNQPSALLHIEATSVTEKLVNNIGGSPNQSQQGPIQEFKIRTTTEELELFSIDTSYTYTNTEAGVKIEESITYFNTFFRDSINNQALQKKILKITPTHVTQMYGNTTLQSLDVLGSISAVSYNGVTLIQNTVTADTVTANSNLIVNSGLLHTNNGKVGIGNSTSGSNPRARLQIKQSGETTGGGLLLERSNTTDYWAIFLDDLNIGGPINNNLGFWYNANRRGYINPDANGGALNFTGQHRNKSETIDLNKKEECLGLIVVSDGTYASFNANSITINEALPRVSLASKRNQKSVFGVISDAEDENAETREYALGNFVSVNNKTVEDTRLIINSLGEGGIWICNVNGNLENGDYITTCEVPGYGMKQDDDLLHNYTVAKITCDCDFDLQSPIYICEEFEHEGKIYKKAFVGCTYHCG